MLSPNEKSKYEYSSHIHDVYTGLGYNYHGNVYKNSISKNLYNSNDKVLSLIEQLEQIINHLIDEVKHIKLHFSIAHNKNDININ